MAYFKNVSGMDLFLPGLGVAPGDGTPVECRDEDLYQYTASANFEPVTADSLGLHQEAEKAEAAAVAESLGALTGEFYDNSGGDQAGEVRSLSAEELEQRAGGNDTPSTLVAGPGGVVQVSPAPPGDATNVDTGVTTPAGDALPPVEQPAPDDPPAGG